MGMKRLERYDYTLAAGQSRPNFRRGQTQPSINSWCSTQPPTIEPIQAYAGPDSGGRHLGDRKVGDARAASDQKIAARCRRGTRNCVINEAEAELLEYMYNSNTAIVNMQCSFLPSCRWLPGWTRRIPDAPARDSLKRLTS